MSGNDTDFVGCFIDADLVAAPEFNAAKSDTWVEALENNGGGGDTTADPSSSGAPPATTDGPPATTNEPPATTDGDGGASISGSVLLCIASAILAMNQR